MGKDLKGRELGKGIIQRKDGRYSARFRNKMGNRIEKYFNKSSEAKQWLLDAKYADAHGIGAESNMTVDAWYRYWIEYIKQKTVKAGTLKVYRYYYEINVKEHIGNMPISKVKPMHCQHILNVMDNNGYAEASIKLTRNMLSSMLSSAVDNDIIMVNPVKRTVKSPKKEHKDRRVLTIAEQNLILKCAEGTKQYSVFLLALQTGMRAGEIIGLRWQDVDFRHRVIHVRQTMTYDDHGQFVVGTPKSNTGIRDIPMTQIAYNELQLVEKGKKDRKVINPKYADIIFLNKNGKPVRNDVYDRQLARIAKNNNIEKLSMHTLRHTFATRCIEAGMNPKTLQKILGHSTIAMTMDLYVHVTEEQKELEMKKFEEQNSLCTKLVSGK